MDQLKFRDLPTIAKVSVALTGIVTWVGFEEIIIDRQHLDVFLPLYRVGNFCVYDAVVGTTIVLATIWLGRRART